ncbi:hypothetical protein HK405_001299, partial [Cladochytrium tenue]
MSQPAAVFIQNLASSDDNDDNADLDSSTYAHNDAEVNMRVYDQADINGHADALQDDANIHGGAPSSTRDGVIRADTLPESTAASSSDANDDCAEDARVDIDDDANDLTDAGVDVGDDAGEGCADTLPVAFGDDTDDGADGHPDNLNNRAASHIVADDGSDDDQTDTASGDDLADERADALRTSISDPPAPAAPAIACRDDGASAARCPAGAVASHGDNVNVDSDSNNCHTTAPTEDERVRDPPEQADLDRTAAAGDGAAVPTTRTTPAAMPAITSRDNLTGDSADADTEAGAGVHEESADTDSNDLADRDCNRLSRVLSDICQ